MAEFNYSIIADPEKFMENRLAAHSDHEYYSSPEAAGKGISDFKVSLNGIWKLMWTSNIAGAPKDFYRTDYDVTGGDDIRVPGHLELQGYGNLCPLGIDEADKAPEGGVVVYKVP